MTSRIVSLSRAAHDHIRRLQNTAGQRNFPSELVSHFQDIELRLRIWAQNIGAFNAGAASLQHRVRAAPKLAAWFQARLEDLQEDLDNVDKLLPEISPANFAAYTNALHAQRLTEPSITEPLQAVEIASYELFELLKAAKEDISSLFKLSALAKQSTHRDHYATAQARIHPSEVMSEEEEADLIGVQFQRLSQSGLKWLRIRLAQANVARRKFLKYRQIHYDHVVLADLDYLQLGSNSERTSEKDESKSETTTVFNLSSASTADPTRVMHLERDILQPEHDFESESQVSTLSYKTESSVERTLKVSSLHDISNDEDEFLCPYCMNEQATKTQRRWENHVFADLKAHSWLEHQLSEHFAWMSCPFCRTDASFGTKSQFQAHLNTNHSSRFTVDQLEQLAESSKHHPTEISVDECRFCDWSSKMRDVDKTLPREQSPHVTPDRYRRHVCLHLEQAALGVIRKETSEHGSEVDDIDNDSLGVASSTISRIDGDWLESIETGYGEDPIPPSLQQRGKGLKCDVAGFESLVKRFVCGARGCFHKQAPWSFVRPDKLTSHIKASHSRDTVFAQCPAQDCLYGPATLEVLGVHITRAHTSDEAARAVLNASPSKVYRCPIWSCRKNVRIQMFPDHIETQHSADQAREAVADLAADGFLINQEPAVPSCTITIKCHVCGIINTTVEHFARHLWAAHLFLDSAAAATDHFLEWRTTLAANVVARSRAYIQSMPPWLDPTHARVHFSATPGTLNCPACSFTVADVNKLRWLQDSDEGREIRSSVLSHHISLLRPESEVVAELYPFRFQILRFCPEFATHPVFDDFGSHESREVGEKARPVEGL
ncbi:hypothetical protein Q7P37_007939 [Cladosporium fusiforme]